MADLTNLLLMVITLSGLAALGITRISSAVRIVAVQGVILGALLIILHSNEITIRLIALTAASIAVKGFLMPLMLLRSIRLTSAEQKVEPYVGFTMSLIAGVLMIGLSFWLADKLPLASGHNSRLIVPVSLSLVFFGFFLLTSRKEAVNQVIGWLIMENGIFVFGLSVAAALPVIVEMGVLLDVFAGVFIMGITMFHIRREFDHIDTSLMTALHDMPGDMRSMRMRKVLDEKASGR